MRSKGQVTWPLFDQEMITREIDQGHQWKLMVEDEIACIWATTFSDPLIWGDKPEPSLYIHRLTTAAAHRGKGHSHKAIQWARVHAKEKGKTYVRLDTVGHNEGLIKHYVSLGFAFWACMNSLRLKDSQPITRRMPLPDLKCEPYEDHTSHGHS